MNKLGTGTYSNVVSIKKNNKFYAMKLYKGDRREGLTFDMLREIAILKKCINSPNIISLLEIDYLKFEHILLPIYPFTLSIYLNTKLDHKNKFVEIKTIFSKICLGLYNLHCAGIIHRDLKPSNILLKNSEEVVIIDNGLSKNISYKRDVKNKSPRIVSPLYRPPEIFLDYQNYSFEVDIWSLGIILIEMLCKNPFSYYSENDILNSQAKLVGTNHIISDFEIPRYPGEMEKFSKYGEDVKSLLIKMLNFDHQKRISIADVLNSEYLKFSFCENQLLNILIPSKKNSEKIDKKDNTKYIDSKIIYENYLKSWTSPYFYTNSEEIRYSITHGMRKVLLLWMIDTCTYYYFTDDVYFLACALLDRYLILSIKTVDEKNFQLLGISCLFISSKFHTINNITLSELMYISNENFTEEQILQMEKNVIRVCKFDLIFPLLSSFDFEFELSLKKIRKYMYICTLYQDYMKYKPYDIVKYCFLICLKFSQNENHLLKGDNKDDNNKIYKEVKKWIDNYTFEDSIEKKFR